MRPVCLAYQPPAIITFLSEQTSNQPAVLFSQNKPAPAIRHQPNEQADGGYPVGAKEFHKFCLANLNEIELHKK
jgi:hypothetical protein